MLIQTHPAIKTNKTGMYKIGVQAGSEEELRKLVGYESLSGLASTISKLKIKCNQ